MHYMHEYKYTYINVFPYIKNVSGNEPPCTHTLYLVEHDPLRRPFVVQHWRRVHRHGLVLPHRPIALAKRFDMGMVERYLAQKWSVLCHIHTKNERYLARNDVFWHMQRAIFCHKWSVRSDICNERHFRPTKRKYEAAWTCCSELKRPYDDNTKRVGTIIAPRLDNRPPAACIR